MCVVSHVSSMIMLDLARGTEEKSAKKAGRFDDIVPGTISPRISAGMLDLTRETWLKRPKKATDGREERCFFTCILIDEKLDH